MTDVEIGSLYELALTDPDQRTRIHQTLVNHSIFIIDKLCKRYKKYPNYKDLRQDAAISLIKAIRSFDHRKEYNFYGWCYRWLKKDIAIQAMRYRKYLDRFEVVPNAHTIAPSDAVNPLDDWFENYNFSQKLRLGLDHLAPKSKVLLEGLMGDSTIEDLAKMLNISYEQTRRLKNTALRDIRNVATHMESKC